MEHLGPDVASRLPKVHYVVEQQYDFKGFHSFPDRIGWQIGRNGQWERKEGSSGIFRRGPLGSIAGFLQAWLFFGLLSEVLGPSIQIHLERFRTQDEHGTCRITTEHLTDYIRKWKQNMGPSEPQTTLQLIQAQLALDEAHCMVSKYCSIAKIGEKPHWNIHPMLALSFMILGETLSHAKAIILEEYGSKMPGWLNIYRTGWGHSHYVLESMEADNWCPSSLRLLQGLFERHATGLLYAMQISHPKSLKLNHSLCSPEECKASRQTTCTTTPAAGGSCGCTRIGPDISVLTRYIREGRVALFRYHAETSLVEIIEYREGMRYAVLSYTWADGFGNSESNSLPACQLQKFVEIFKRPSMAKEVLLTGEQPSLAITDIPFWIDTLAIPVGTDFKEERREAIRHMHKMYNLATYTFVLDAGLMVQEIGTTYAETAMKITMSRWITRLWTLQEAYLSKKIYFIFEDNLVDMDDLERLRKFDLVSPIPMAARYYYQALLGPERENYMGEGRSNSHDFLASVWKAMQWRKTSLAQHETLALATLLQMETAPFDDVESCAATHENVDYAIQLDQKMEMLLSMVAHNSNYNIPPWLIFVSGPKLSKKGFRWAPRSWLTEQHLGHSYLLSSQKRTQLTDSGLVVCYPGFILHIAARNDDIDMRNEIEFPSDRSLNEWIIARNADSSNFLRSTRDRNGYAVIASNRQVEPVPKIALLVKIVGVVGTTLHVRMIKRVWIQVEVDHGRIDTLKREFKSLVSNAICGEPLGPDQEWCVDGLEDRGHFTRRENVLQPSTNSVSPEPVNVGWFSGWQVSFLASRKLQFISTRSV